MESILFTTLTRNSFSMTSEESGEEKWGGLMGERGGCLCNVWLLFYGYPFVSGAGQYFVESKSNSKICRYIKAYFSLYDLSL
jgi:hypothetical protein